MAIAGEESAARTACSAAARTAARYKVLGTGIFSLILGLGVARFAYPPC